MDFEIGRVVFSKAGRDKGLLFVVCLSEGDYLFLIDGRTRLLGHPKKKKKKHVQPVNMVDETLKKKLLSGAYVENAEIRNILKQYMKKDDV